MSTSKREERFVGMPADRSSICLWPGIATEPFAAVVRSAFALNADAEGYQSRPTHLPLVGAPSS